MCCEYILADKNCYINIFDFDYNELFYKTFDVKKQPKNNFVQKLSEMKSTKKILSSFNGKTEKAVEASFLMSLRIVKC